MIWRGDAFPAPAPGQILADGDLVGAKPISHCFEPRHECLTARRVRKLVACKIGVDLESGNPIELRRTAQRLDTLSSTDELDQAHHGLKLHGDRCVVEIARGTRTPGREQTVDPSAGALCGRCDDTEDADSGTNDRQRARHEARRNWDQPGQEDETFSSD